VSRRVSLEDWHEAARRALPRFVYDYLAAGAEDGLCLARNRADLDAVRLTPRVLRSTLSVDPSMRLFERTWPQPFAVAPTGLNGLARPQGDLLLARAAAARDLVFCVSTAANASMEQLRHELPDLRLWLQLYVLSERGVAEEMIARAERTGVEALLVTVDVPVSGKREADLRNGFALPLRPSAAMLADIALHPGWALRQALGATLNMENLAPGGKASPQVQAALLSRGMDRSLDWAALDWIRALWKKPLLIKGVLHAEDARTAVQRGVDALVVSNHGGRQLDAAPSSIEALPLIVSAVQGAIPVLLDSGIRRGSDIARALALGADAVLLGRAPLYGLAADGEIGVAAVLDLLTEELHRTLCLLGVDRLAGLKDCAHPGSTGSAG
jgi:(S)-mandelate dehydrogenase